MVKKRSPFDVSFAPLKMKPMNFYGHDNISKEKNKSTLTQTQKSKIKNIAKACEMPKCNNDPYEVHHIKYLEDGGTDAYSNLIVLCSNCHKDAHGKNPTGKSIPKTKLREIVTKRSKTQADLIKAVLVKKKTNSNSSPSNRNPFGF